MNLYDMVQLKEHYPKGTTGVIVEIFENTDAYLEIVDDAGNTIDVKYNVPLSILEKKNWYDNYEITIDIRWIRDAY